MRADKNPFQEMQVVPTGLHNLDKITGIGGVPLRAITQCSGRFSVGKSSLGYSIIANAQKMKLATLWVDSEMCFYDGSYAEALGVSLAKLNLIQSRLAEDVLDMTEGWIATHKNAYVVFDSIGTLLPRSDAEKRAGEVTVGAQARLISPFLRKVVPYLMENNIGMFVCNHEKPDIMGHGFYTPGGRAMEHYSGLWLRLSKAGKKVMQGEKQIGKLVDVKVWKNKLAKTEGAETTLTMMFGAGFSASADLFQNALDSGIITRKGNTYLLNGTKIATGATKTRETIQSSSQLQEALQKAINTK